MLGTFWGFKGGGGSGVSEFVLGGGGKGGGKGKGEREKGKGEREMGRRERYVWASGCGRGQQVSEWDLSNYMTKGSRVTLR